MLDSSQILTPREYMAVVHDLHRRAKHSPNAFLGLAIFRLAAGCGCRAGEICGLNMADLWHEREPPYLLVRGNISKGRTHKVPLWWDNGTRADLVRWYNYRLNEHGAGPDDPLVCSVCRRTLGKRFDPNAIWYRFRRACGKSLGRTRIKTLTTHHGRHTFATYALQAGHSLITVSRALGHASLATTQVYAHFVEELAMDVPRNTFDFDDRIARQRP